MHDETAQEAVFFRPDFGLRPKNALTAIPQIFLITASNGRAHGETEVKEK